MYGLTQWQFRLLVEENASIAWPLLQAMAKRTASSNSEAEVRRGGDDVDRRVTPVERLSDELLVARCRRGDSEAWAVLVERFSRYVYAICVRGFRLQAEDAEDVFQEVFAKTHERLDRLRDDAAVRPWIGQLTRRCCIDRLRSARDELATDDVDVADPTDGLVDVERALDVQQALRSPRRAV